MMVIVGNASSGKTTSLDLLKGWDRIFVTHEVTPAAFVPAKPDQDEDNRGDDDLLPKIVEQVLWVPEMGTWFGGDGVGNYMRVLAGVADGSGYVRSTGTHGTRGYDGAPGDYQFGMMGATIEPSPSAWSAMGNAGSRLLFHEMPNESDLATVRKQIFSQEGPSYPERKLIVQEKITNWLRTIWHEHDGEIKMESEDEDGEIAETLTYMGNLIAVGRSVSYGTMTNENVFEGGVQREDPKRATQMLRFTASARAVMDGRTRVEVQDLELCTRIAFASMPEKHREVYKLILHPESGGRVKTSDVVNGCSTINSKNTAKKRMQKAADLGLCVFEAEGESVRGGKADVLRLNDEGKKTQWTFSRDTEPNNPGPLPWPFD